MLILYPITLWNSLISSNNFLESLGLSIYSVMPSANNDSFTSSFSIFLRFFNYLIAMARTFNTILNESDKVGHPCLVSDLWGKPSVFTTEYNVNCGFDIYGLYYVEIYFFYTHFVETFFYHKWKLNFMICFFYTCWEKSYDVYSSFCWCGYIMLICECRTILPSLK